MTPAFSIIVPIYKVEKYLRRCVDSILGQTFPDFELFLVDDGSPDGSGAICDQYAQKDARVQVIHQPNRGVTAARRTALDRARADYVCFVDSDDWVKENWLQTVHSCLSENGWPDMVLFGENWVWDRQTAPRCAGQPPRPGPGLYDKARLEREVYPYMIYDSRRKHCMFQELIAGYLWEKAFRRQLLLDHFIQDEGIPVFEDVLMFYECLYNADSLFVCPELLYFYWQRDDSVIHRCDPGDILYLEKGRRYLDEHLLRQAPQLRPQTDMFFTAQLCWMFRDGLLATGSLRQTARRLAGPLGETGLASHLAPPRQPFYRLFLGLLKLRLVYPALILTWLVFIRKKQHT